MCIFEIAFVIEIIVVSYRVVDHSYDISMSYYFRSSFLFFLSKDFWENFLRDCISYIVSITIKLFVDALWFSVGADSSLCRGKLADQG